MQTVVTCEEMKALDSGTIEKKGIPSLVLMERASLAVADQAEKHLAPGGKVLCVCGNGNNGGDGLAAARILRGRGYQAEVYLPVPDGRKTPEAEQQLSMALASGIILQKEPCPDSCEVIIDALFGNGLSRPLTGKYLETVKWMNQAKAFRIAVDLPSGISGDTGQVLGDAFRADVTVAFAFQKRGHCLYPGRAYSGEVVTADIGIADELEKKSGLFLEKNDLLKLPPRVPWGNKGNFGKILILAGSPGMCGAAFFSAQAALSLGAGLVRVQTAPGNRIPLQILVPEAVLSTDCSPEETGKLLDWCSTAVAGPGMGISENSRERLLQVMDHSKKTGLPLILDADALTILSQHREMLELLHRNVILTPHIGEFARLSGLTAAEIKSAPAESAQAFVNEHHCVLVMKDACTLTCGQDSPFWFNPSGNDAMATAGSGDVLTGVLAGILCKYLPEIPENPVLCAAQAVYLHGLAGEAASLKYGHSAVTARKILEMLPDLLKEIGQ